MASVIGAAKFRGGNLEDIAVLMAKTQEAVTQRTEIITIRLDCGCEVVYKEVGAVSCYAHGNEDPVRQKTEI